MAESNREIIRRIAAELLQPASFVYGIAGYLRLLAYARGYLKRSQFPARVISIGNLTCGGTGKTPVTIDLARRLIDSGQRIAILSRGYKRKSSEVLLIASDGHGQIADSYSAGDEPYMMAQELPEAVVIVSAKRAVAAAIAIDVYNADVLLLDDGFQHLPMARDCDIVLIDYNDNLQASRLLPAGRWREPLPALSRAHWVVITKIPENYDDSQLANLHEIIARHAPQARITGCRFLPDSLQRFAATDAGLSPSSLADIKVVAFCGIARPSNFFDLLRQLKADVVKTRSFADHHWFSPSDIQILRSDLVTTGANLLVTTEKDAARLSRQLCQDLPICVLKLKTEWHGAVPVADFP